jgi:hypothetical protein
MITQFGISEYATGARPHLPFIDYFFAGRKHSITSVESVWMIFLVTFHDAPASRMSASVLPRVRTGIWVRASTDTAAIKPINTSVLVVNDSAPFGTVARAVLEAAGYRILSPRPTMARQRWRRRPGHNPMSFCSTSNYPMPTVSPSADTWEPPIPLL